MLKFQNIKKKDVALILFSCLVMSSAHAMEHETERNVRNLPILQDKSDIDRNIQNLIKVHNAAKEFYIIASKRGAPLDKKELEEQIDLLYGKTNTFFWNDKGLVENLWKTESWLWWLKNNHSESPNNSGCAENRLARGETDEDKERIRKFHMDTLKYLTEGMLMQKPKTVRDIINGDNLKNKTYPFVPQHMRSIVKNKNNFDWLNEAKNTDYLNWQKIPIKVIHFSDSPFLEDKIHDAHSQCSKDEIGFLKDGMDLYCIYNDTFKRIREQPGAYYRLHYKISDIMKNHKSENRSLKYQVIYLNDTVGFSEEDRIRLLDLASEFIDIPKNKADLLDRFLRQIENSDPAKNVHPQPLFSKPFGIINGKKNPRDTEVELGVMSPNHTATQTPHISTNLHQPERQDGDNKSEKNAISKVEEKDKKKAKKIKKDKKQKKKIKKEKK